MNEPTTTAQYSPPPVRIARGPMRILAILIFIPLILVSVAVLAFPLSFYTLKVKKGDTANALLAGAGRNLDPAVAMNAGDTITDWFQRMAYYFVAPASVQYRLASAYSQGIGFAKDHEFAAALLYSAAKSGNVGAQFDLARVYDEQGTPKSEVAASQWLLKAAEGGDVNAQFLLASRYRFGIGVVRDASKSEQWYRAAAEQGDTRAIEHLNRVLPRND